MWARGDEVVSSSRSNLEGFPVSRSESRLLDDQPAENVRFDGDWNKDPNLRLFIFREGEPLGTFRLGQAIENPWGHRLLGLLDRVPPENPQQAKLALDAATKEASQEQDGGIQW